MRIPSLQEVPVIFNKEDALEVRFIAADDGRLPVIQSSFNPSQWVRKPISDKIRFTFDKSLIQQLSSALPCDACIEFTACPYYGHPGHCQIEAKYAKIFLETIQKYQQQPFGKLLLASQLRKLLTALQANDHLSLPEAYPIRSQLALGLTLKQFWNGTLACGDMVDALSLAWHFRNSSDMGADHHAIGWLCEAKRFIGGARLADFIDLDEFFQGIKSLAFPGIFAPEMKELLTAARKNPALVKTDSEVAQ